MEIYNFFDNSTIGSTIAAVIAVFFGACIAGYQYRAQKNIDRRNQKKETSVNFLFEIGQAVQEAIFYYNRATKTRLEAERRPTASSVDELARIMREVEIPRISHLINESIPLLAIKIKGHIDLYFSDLNEVMVGYNEFYKELQSIHGALYAIKDQAEPFKKSSLDISGMSTEDLERFMLRIKKLSMIIETSK